MTEDDPVYLTKRMMTEQEYAHSASCSEAAVHQNWQRLIDYAWRC